MDDEKLISFDADLRAPADAVPSHPPVITKVQLLPFGKLTWENFERLCYRLAGKAERVEYVARYGRPGQAQQGIDLFARMPNTKYEVWQAKRYETITPSELKTIVQTFRTGKWKAKSERLILAVQASLADNKLQDELEAQAAELSAEGITFLPRGGEELSNILRDHPEIVDDFPGRSWVKFLAPKLRRRWELGLTEPSSPKCGPSYVNYYRRPLPSSGRRCCPPARDG